MCDTSQAGSKLIMKLAISTAIDVTVCVMTHSGVCRDVFIFDIFICVTRLKQGQSPY